MKPSEMSTSRLSAAIDHWLLEYNLENSTLNDLIEEMETRLRNSIPKQDIKNAYEEGWYDGAIAVSGQRMTALHDVLFAEYWAGSGARTALGLEGGE